MYVYAVSMFALPVCRLDIGQSLLRAVLPDVSKQGTEAQKIEDPRSPWSVAPQLRTVHFAIKLLYM